MHNIVQVKELKQLEPIEPPGAKVQVTFDIFGSIAPDSVVQIYASGRSDTSLTPAALKEEVKLHENEHFGYSTILDLRAGAFLFLHFCPRTKTNGVPDPEIDGQSFDTFCTVIPFTTKSIQPQTGGDKPAPVITSVETHPATLRHKNRIRISWTSSRSYGFFQVRVAEKGHRESQEEIDSGGRSGFFELQSTRPGVTHTFKVQGCDSGILGASHCSPFSPATEVEASNNTSSLRQFLEGETEVRKAFLSVHPDASIISLKSFMGL
jgi:hypothetical protein